MIQTISICNKDYEMKANLHIYEVYKNEFGEELVQVISRVNKSMLDVMKTDDDLIKFEIASKNAMECVKIAWVMIKELDDNFKPLEEWEKELDGDIVGNWLNEVITLAFSPFRSRKVPQDHKQANK